MIKEKIKLEDSMLTIATKMSEGNPGALRVVLEIIKRGGTIDPNDAFGGLGTILHLDSYGIYADKIWMLFKDVCGQSLGKTIALTRAVQMGMLSHDKLLYAINNRGAGVNVDEEVKKVMERLPKFNLEG